MVFIWVALLGFLGDVWAARVGKTENLGDFIKTFTNGVVAGGADDFEMIVALHVNDLGVATTDDGCEEWKLGIVATEPVGVNVRLEMMGRVERLVVKDGESAGGKGADEKTSDETRSMSDGNGVNIVNGEIGVIERFFNDGIDGFDVAAGGNFRDDAAIFGMDVDLRDDNIRQDFLSVFDNCCGGFVAR